MITLKKSALKNNKGLTLLEVLVAVFILALVAAPLINMFVTSTRFTVLAEDNTKTTYLAQAKIEELRTKTYGQLFNLLGTSPASNPNHAAYDGKYYTIETSPAGAISKAAFSGTPSYAHLFIRGGSATFTGPDGKVATGSSGSITLAVAGGGYTISGGVSASGSVPGGRPLGLIINCGTASFSSIVTLSGVSACAVYETPAQAQVSSMNVVGISTSNLFMYDSDNPPATALVDVKCLVYESSSSATPQCVVQDTLEVAAP